MVRKITACHRVFAVRSWRAGDRKMEKNLPQRIEIVGSILLCQTFCNPWGLMALNAHDIGQKEITREWARNKWQRPDTIKISYPTIVRQVSICHFALLSVSSTLYLFYVHSMSTPQLRESSQFQHGGQRLFALSAATVKSDPFWNWYGRHHLIETSYESR